MASSSASTRSTCCSVTRADRRASSSKSLMDHSRVQCHAPKQRNEYWDSAMLRPRACTHKSGTLVDLAMSGLPWRSQPVDATLYPEGEMECGLMGHRFHRGFTAAEKTELWDRWKRGESLKAIGRAFGKQSSSIYFLVAPHGGIRPAERRRSRLALTLAEREVISRGVTAHQSARSIARLLGRSPSTVSREMSRNGGYDRYRATLADENAWARSRRPKCCKLA